MIDINLIPAALRKNGKGPSNALKINIPQDVLVGVGAGVVLLIVTVHLLLGVWWLAELGRMSLCQAQWDKLAPDKKIIDGFKEESRNLNQRLNLISGMTINKSVTWSPKFNAISDALSRGLWLRRMVLDKDGLSIDGSVVSKSQNEIANVGLFISALKNNDEFMKDFSSLEVNSIQRGENNSVEVTDFTVMAKLK